MHLPFMAGALTLLQLTQAAIIPSSVLHKTIVIQDDEPTVPSPSHSIHFDDPTRPVSVPPKITVTVDATFNISQAFPPDAKSVDITFDKSEFVLESARVVEPNTEEWYFHARETGIYEVETFIAYGKANYGRKTVVVVEPPKEDGLGGDKIGVEGVKEFDVMVEVTGDEGLRVVIDADGGADGEKSSEL